MEGRKEDQAGSRRIRKIFLSAVIVACALALIYLSMERNSGHGPKPLPDLSTLVTAAPPQHNIKAPDFTVQDLAGEKVSLSEFKGKVVVINFWSVTCAPCLIEMEGLERLAQKMAGKPFQLMAITTDSRKTVNSLLKHSDINLPIYLDQSYQAHSQYGVFGLPVTYIIAPDGTVANHIIGAADWGHHTVIQYLDKLIQKSDQDQKKSLH
jgi:peroxiredoxin